MSYAKWIGAAFGIAFVAACGASGTSETGFTADAGSGGGEVDSGGIVVDSGSGVVDSGVVAPKDSGVDAAIDSGPTGNPVGFPCGGDSDCTSGLCKPVVAGSGSVCVSTCTKQADCSDNFFCDPLTAGSTDGYCVPHSPAHCAVCGSNSDCGSLSEVCGVAAGDNAAACHIDCSLAPTAGTNAACPPEYNCVATTVDGAARQVCMPKAPITKCVDALGGYCDRISTPQACARTDATAGTCVGYRACSAASNRYGNCDASAPSCKMCGVSDPTGCTENLCSNAAQDVNNCGTCGHVCPGLGQPSDNVTCSTSSSPASCTFSCQGEHYDVDNNPANGCEVADPVTGNHAQDGTAAYVGSLSCHDGSSNPNISGQIPSDLRGARTNPSVSGFDSITDSAPDWYRIDASGGACYDDFSLTLQMSGSSHAACYVLTIVTNKETRTCQTDGTGSCNVNDGSGSYSDGSTIYISVVKSSGAGCTGIDDNPSYTVTGHL